MNAVELRKKSTIELTKQVQAWREKVAGLIRERGISEQKNVREVRALRKDIARALTVMSEQKNRQ